MAALLSGHRDCPKKNAARGRGFELASVRVATDALVLSATPFLSN